MFCGGVCVSCLDLTTSSALLTPCLWMWKVLKPVPVVFRRCFSASEALKDCLEPSLCLSWLCLSPVTLTLRSEDWNYLTCWNRITARSLVQQVVFYCNL